MNEYIDKEALPYRQRDSYAKHVASLERGLREEMSDHAETHAKLEEVTAKLDALDAKYQTLLIGVRDHKCNLDEKIRTRDFTIKAVTARANDLEAQVETLTKQMQELETELAIVRTQLQLF